MTRFFVVWREGGGPPTVKHQNELQARSEAARLARQFPGDRFHVLGLVDTCVKDDVRWLSRDDEEIPF